MTRHCRPSRLKLEISLEDLMMGSSGRRSHLSWHRTGSGMVAASRTAIGQEQPKPEKAACTDVIRFLTSAPLLDAGSYWDRETPSLTELDEATETGLRS